MPAINIGDIQIPVQMVQQTTPSLKIMDSSGTIYYVDAMPGECPDCLKVSDGTNVYSIGTRHLVHEASGFDSCETVSLAPGCYYVEVRGGRGGDGGNNDGSGADAVMQSYSFTITTTTDVYVFRGSDGNAGGVNIDGNIASGGGGGASGAPSMVAFGDTVVISEGGAGGIGGRGVANNSEVYECGAGGGGNAGENSNGLNAVAHYTWDYNFLMCGAGGGGAPNGAGGAEASALSGGYGGGASVAGGQDSGGDGGNAWRIVGSTNGGAGGATVAFSCGGHTLNSYGGGGGGAVQAKFTLAVDMDGGAGGTGTTGASDTSYVRIYKFG